MDDRGGDAAGRLRPARHPGSAGQYWLTTGGTRMQTLRDAAVDAWFALRVMRKSVLATATIVLCLGFSIGATAAVVAWMEGLVLRPVRGVPEVGRLVSLKSTATGGTESNLSYPAYREIRDGGPGAGARPFGALAAFGLRRFNVRTTAEDAERHAEPVWGILASANYFDVLRVRPALGRGFLAGEDSAAGREPVVVISHALWRRRFDADPAVLGRRLWANGRELTVVGVAPPDFTGTISGLAFDLWVPVTMHAALADNPALLEDRAIRWLATFGRLASGASLASANGAAGALGTRLAAAYEAD